MNSLLILGVEDAGEPNRERIVVRATEVCEMTNYFAGLAIRSAHGRYFPLNDNFFWFGNGLLRPNDWVFLYTGGGESKVHDVPNQPSKIYTVHWNRPNVLFASDEVVPYLGYMDDFEFGGYRDMINSGEVVSS